MDSTLKEILIAIIAAVLPVLTTYAVRYFSSKTKQITESVKDVTLRTAINECADAVSAAVAYMSQTYVDDLKKTNSFDDAAKQIAANGALDKAIGMISEKSKVLITASYGSLEDYLKTKIEAEVKSQKQ
jgi:high-affinity Fe2+/Pb2+ permease